MRSGKKRTQADTDKRNRMILYGVAGAGIVGIVVVLLALFVLGKSGSTTAHFDGPNVDLANLPGLMRKAPPWPNNTEDLDARIKDVGVHILPQEGNVLHIHQHLDIFRDGKHVTVPALIGIKRKGQGAEFAELHTHDTSGIVHLESDRAQAFSLGQFRRVGELPREELCRWSVLAARAVRGVRQREEDSADRRSCETRPPAARRDRNRVRDAAGDHPLELQLARRLLGLAAAGVAKLAIRG